MRSISSRIHHPQEFFNAIVAEGTDHGQEDCAIFLPQIWINQTKRSITSRFQQNQRLLAISSKGIKRSGRFWHNAVDDHVFHNPLLGYIIVFIGHFV